MQVYRCNICGEVYIGAQKPASCPFCGAHSKYFVPAQEWEILKSETLSDISKKHLNAALDLEINNTNFYHAVSERSKNIFIKGEFRGLSKVENEHASTICKHLWIERPVSDAGTDKAVDSDEDNIKEAHSREQRAVRLYSEAAKEVPEPEIKEFFLALMQIESDHIGLLEKKIEG